MNKKGNEKRTFVCPTCHQSIKFSKKDEHLENHEHSHTNDMPQHTHEAHDHDDHNEDEHDNHIGHNHNDLDSFPTYLWKLILGIIFLIPVLISLFTSLPSNEFLKIITNDWFLFIEATVVMIIFGIDYFVSSFTELRQKRISVNLLVSISMIASYLFSFFVIIFTSSAVMFDATIEVAVIIYLGKYLEDYMSLKITRDLNNVLELYSKEAIIFINDEERKILPNEIKKDDILVVYPGEKIPTDGIIWKGITEIDESTFTGESLFVTKKEGDFVYGGTISKTKVFVKATRKIKDSILSKIIDKIDEAKNSKPETQKIADKIATYLIPTVLIIAVITFFFHLILAGSVFTSFEVFVTVLVIACPCSFAMLTPLSILVANGESAKKHIILNSPEVFEKITSIDSVIFDKTGTLTKGNLSIIDYKIEKEMLPILVSAERHFNHPISKAIVKHFKDMPMIEDDIKYEDIVGKGIKINYKNVNYYVGSYVYMNEVTNLGEDNDLISLRGEGKLVIYFFDDQKIIGNFVLSDTTKNEAREIVQKLQKRNIDVYMVTGDSKATSEFVAREIGIKVENVYSEVLPINKSEIVKQMQEKGKKVVFVGDGINDAIALEQADLGISMGSANDIAIQSSDITIQNNNLRNVDLALRISKTTVWTIYVGFAIAILYNLIFIPLATIGLLTPIIGATSMALNDTLAMFVALSLKHIKFKK